jgi:hypothetical protein
MFIYQDSKRMPVLTINVANSERRQARYTKERPYNSSNTLKHHTAEAAGPPQSTQNCINNYYIVDSNGQRIGDPNTPTCHGTNQGTGIGRRGRAS